jgi:RNA-binding protein
MTEPSAKPPAPAAVIATKQSAYLRGLAHHLEPVVLLGKEGLTEAVVAAAKTALLSHELIKVRLPAIEKPLRKEMTAALATATSAHVAGEIGRVAVLYKRHPNEPKIKLPK